MPALTSIGEDAVGTSTNSVSSSLSCLAAASSSITTNLTTAVRLGASVAASAAITASLAVGGALLTSSPTAIATFNGSLATQVTLQSLLQAVAAVQADLTTTQAIPMFTPSAARTINVQATSPVFTGGKWWTLTDPKKPRGLKDPDSVIDITFDWSAWLSDISADTNNIVTISDVTFTLNGLNSVGSFSDGTKVTVFVSGGTAGTATTAACKIKTLTTPQRTDERTVYIDIAEE